MDALGHRVGARLGPVHCVAHPRSLSGGPGDNEGVLTDDQIATMSPAERRDLIKRLAQPVDDIAPSTHWLRRTREIRIAVMVLSVVLLVPWIVYLAVTLPRAYVAHNWDRTWVGFDLLLLVMLAARRRCSASCAGRRCVLTAFATGVLLLCDAWFDVMTAHGEDRTWSVLTALVVELPLAALLIARFAAGDAAGRRPAVGRRGRRAVLADPDPAAQRRRHRRPPPHHLREGSLELAFCRVSDAELTPRPAGGSVSDAAHLVVAAGAPLLAWRR